MEAGLAIVVLAIVLDRMSQAAAVQRPSERNPKKLSSLGRHPNLVLALVFLAATTIASLFIPALAKIPPEITYSTAPWWKAGVDWITQNFFDTIEYFRTGFLIYVLNPMRAFFESLPWLGVLLILGYAGYRLGAISLAVVIALLAAFCATTG